jgi:hypothetical protein
MEMKPVYSSFILSVGYSAGQLRVKMESGRVYDHWGVPESVYHAFMNAYSKGSYYNSQIRGRYGPANRPSNTGTAMIRTVNRVIQFTGHKPVRAVPPRPVRLVRSDAIRVVGVPSNKKGQGE